MTAIPHPIATPHAHEHDAAHAHHHEDLGFVKKYLYSCDHKIIGIQFMFLGLLFMVLGGLLAMLIRWQLAWPSASLTPGYPVPIYKAPARLPRAAVRTYLVRPASHAEWCAARYRSYDVRTDTYQPYHGPRRVCRSAWR